MSVRQINTSVFDALFRQAVIDNFNEELESLPSDEELARQYTFSKAHETRMKKLFARQMRIERLRATAKWSRRLVAVITIAVTMLFGSLMLVPQVRATILGTIVEWYEEFIRISSDTSESDKTGFEPSYIPKGFIEYARYDNEAITTILYMNEEGAEILFQSSLSSGSLSVDNEGHDYEVSLVDGVEYHKLTAISEGKDNSIIWDSFGQRYVVISRISMEEIQRIAISVEKQK